ncbi:hypothetical protein I4U23_023401 [Adineta vaga]|nr:hypothetical protein I4U23_023401 [Adineta vaga]
MKLTIKFICILVFLATMYVTIGADDLDCMCMCCKDGKCTDPHVPMFPLMGCTDDTCKAACVNKDPTYCKDAGSVPGGMCMPGGAISHVFNRYTTFGTVILAFIVTAIVRF